MTELIKYPAAKDAQEYVVPDAVEYICHQAFRSVGNLKQLTLSENTKGISMFAFDSNRSLERLILLTQTVPANMDFSSFSGVRNITLYVLEGLIDEYKAKEPWTSFKEILAYDKNLNSLFEIHYPESYYMIYTVNGSIINAKANREYLLKLPRGQYIINGHKVFVEGK